jgi:polysaccharide pyruvyl transferase WcaK-like protein
LKSGVPAICIGYEHKALGFFEQCNLDDYVIDISNLSVDGLKEKVDLLLSKYKEVVEIIEQNMPVMEDNATITPRKILELIST